MALQNLQQYGCQSGNKLKEKSRGLNRNSSRNENETMFGSGYENCPEFGVLQFYIPWEGEGGYDENLK